MSPTVAELSHLEAHAQIRLEAMLVARRSSFVLDDGEDIAASDAVAIFVGLLADVPDAVPVHLLEKVVGIGHFVVVTASQARGEEVLQFLLRR